jgi:hypothetical protein
LHELHREEGVSAFSDELSERDEVRVVKVLKRAKLVLEPREGVGVVVAERLERDAHASLDVTRLVDDAHPALADLADELEALSGDRVANGEQGDDQRSSLVAARAQAERP